MSSIKAIRINPYLQTVSIIELPADNKDGTYGPTYEGLRAAVFLDRPAGYIEHVNLGAGIHGWVDEEGLLKDWDSQAFFSIGPTPARQLKLAGNCILTCEDNAENARDWPEHRMPLEFIERQVTWIDPANFSVPAPTITAMDDNMNPKGPSEPLDGKTAQWDYKHQPNKR